MAAQTLTVLTSHLHLVRRFGLAGGSLSHPLLPSMEAGSTANHSCTRAIAARLTVSEITVFDFQDWLRLNLGPVLQNESNRAVRFSYERHSHGSQGTRTDFGGAAAARSMALNKRPSASKMCSAVSPTAAVLPRLPVPLRFAHILHIGEILFLRILQQFDKMRSLFSGPLNGFSENRNGSVLQLNLPISAVSLARQIGEREELPSPKTP